MRQQAVTRYLTIASQVGTHGSNELEPDDHSGVSKVSAGLARTPSPRRLTSNRVVIIIILGFSNPQPRSRPHRVGIGRDRRSDVFTIDTLPEAKCES
jgi:hypothetical protein